MDDTWSWIWTRRMTVRNGESDYGGQGAAVQEAPSRNRGRRIQKERWYDCMYVYYYWMCVYVYDYCMCVYDYCMCVCV